MFVNSQQHADKAQHSFSAASVPTLHEVLPALKKLYLTWERASTKPRYSPFAPAISAAMDKLNKYYRLTAKSDAHIMAMGTISFSHTVHPSSADYSTLTVLDPTLKLGHFRDYWEVDSLSEVEDLVQAKVCLSPTPSVYANMLQSNPSPKSPGVCKSTSNLAHKAGRPNINDTDSEDDRHAQKPTSIPSKTWMNEWKAYINTVEDVPEGMEVVRWWGISNFILSASIANSCVAVWLSLPDMACPRAQ